MRAIITVISLCGGLFLWSGHAMAIEEPPFRVLQSEPPFEHRLYTGFVVAETDVVGDFDAASRSGFRRVAGYIFGDNQLQSGGNRKIEMTAPVTVEPKDQGWRLHFVMPSAESLSSLPKPNNPDVKLRQVPEHAVAAIRFSGFTTQAAVQEQTSKLRNWMSSKQLEAAGPAQVARYNDPFTLPWRRRNEILIPVAPQR
jgi:SOUL heme-binding protein